MNNVILIGRLARDPELRFIPASGTGVAKFTLAVDRELSKEKKQEAASKGQPTADFINITVFGKQAENCANYLAKGSQCAVSGRIQTGSYTPEGGEKKYTTDVIANRIEFLNTKGDGNNAAAPNENKGNNNTSAPNNPVSDEVDNSFFEHINGDDIGFDDEDIPF